MKEPLGILLVDDQRMFLDAMRLLIERTEGMQWIGGAASGEEAVEWCTKVCPDVVLMDIDLPGIDGTEATRRIRELCPDAKVVAITALQPDDVMAEAIAAGACGFVPKTHAADDLVSVIRRAVLGEMVLPTGDLTATLLRLGEARREHIQAEGLIRQLTPREIEILQAIAEGLSIEEIAGRLFISSHTVNSHMRSILTKLGVHSRLEAVLFALRYGAVRLPRVG